MFLTKFSNSLIQMLGLKEKKIKKKFDNIFATYRTMVGKEFILLLSNISWKLIKSRMRNNNN